MKNTLLKIAIILIVGMAIMSCSKDGVNGKDGINGTNGTNGTNGSNGTNGIDASIQNTGFYVGPNQDRAAQSVGNAAIKIVLDRELFDNINAFNTSTSELVIPTSGFYHFSAKMQFNGNFTTSSLASLSFYVNGLQLESVVYSLIGSNPSISITTNNRLNSGDVITMRISQGDTTSHTISTNLGVSNFSGYRVY